MLNRRDFAVLASVAATFPARAQDAAIPFYDAIGPTLSVYGLDVAAGNLTPRQTVTLPANVQYAWPHPSKRFLYVASTNGKPGIVGGGYGAAGDTHRLNAFQVDPRTGGLTPHGPVRALTARPIHLSVDESGTYILAAYNAPSHVTVHRVNPDGTLGDAVPQSPKLDFGIYAHQVRVTPGNKSVVLVARGNNAGGATPEDPGAIKLFRFSQGLLSPLQSLPPGGGHGFGPRHLDFHPRLPLAYVSCERNNRLDVYGLRPDGRFTPQALFQASTLSEARLFRGGGPSAVHVHPNGRFVYVPNRGAFMVDFAGKQVSNGGFNSVAVFAIDSKTGAPELIQQAPAHGFELRTFTIDPSGSLLIAASQMPMLVRDGGKIATVSAGLSFYRIGADGRLTFVRKQDMNTDHGTHFWCGLLSMV